MANNAEVRAERPADVAAIRAVTVAAFASAPFSDQTEAAIVDALRQADALSISLVATEDGDVVGHVAFSPVLINDQSGDWYGLGPVSVRPDRQLQGIGRRLIARGLEELRNRDAAGCVVFGEPSYYGRFGFIGDPELRYKGAPPGYLQRLLFKESSPKGEVRYHAVFDRT